jgi:SWI/SNF-related matrix-associated actin-dependent regulator 1 of chromatin subfamily A
MCVGVLVQAITLAACYPADWPLLVICPTSLLSVWAVELEAWLPPTLKTVEGRPHTLTIRSDKDKKRLLGAGGACGRLCHSTLD